MSLEKVIVSFTGLASQKLKSVSSSFLPNWIKPLSSMD